MKCKLVVNLLTATLIMSGLVVGCKKSVQHPTPIPGISPNADTTEPPGKMFVPSTTPMKPADDTIAKSVKPNDDLGMRPLSDKGPRIDWIPNESIFKDQIVYFEFDKSIVRSSEMPKLQEVVRRMKAEFPGKALQVQGHCDERGTEGYNQALGERRALAVREKLLGLGMNPDDVETISYGEDRPAVQGHNEAAWSKNRRGVCALLSPPASSSASNETNK